MSVLVAEGICKTYREGRESLEVLRGIDLRLDAGEVVALEGPSGSGKSTLLSILGFILTPSAGRVTVQGRAANENAELVRIRRECIGFVFQQYNLVPALTALENVALALRVRGRGHSDALARARAALREVELEDRMHVLPRNLSGGQKQRVAIARAISGDPPIVLADEPTANLDSAAGGQILRLFRTLATTRRCAFLIVTHDREVRRISDRVLGIRDGRVLRDDVRQTTQPAQLTHGAST